MERKYGAKIWSENMEELQIKTHIIGVHYESKIRGRNDLPSIIKWGVCFRSLTPKFYVLIITLERSDKGEL
jgi:hypothetical protein